MIIRKASYRGKANYGWLNANYTFSFSRYFDPHWTGFGPLLVMNEDYVAAQNGFPPHSHDNMEILTLILEGSIEHRDTLGTREVIRPGEVQLMSAGSGITHSEMNPEVIQTTRLYQVWIEPDTENLKPTYQTKPFSLNDPLTLVASKSGKDSSLIINQSVEIYLGTLKKEESFDFGPGWVQVIKGKVLINSSELTDSDGAGLKENLTGTATEDTQILYFKFTEKSSAV